MKHQRKLKTPKNLHNFFIIGFKICYHYGFNQISMKYYPLGVISKKKGKIQKV